MLALGPREIAAAIRVLARGDLARYSAGGTSQTSRFEADLEKRFDTGFALGVNSGTSALICALVGLGIGPGDEVLVPAYTWVSSAAAPLAVGATPVLVEIDESLTIDPVDLESKITGATRAIIAVHMLNLVCDMDSIMEIARRRDLAVVEDACQAIGVTYRGRRTGTIGDVGTYSFNQHKNIRSGEGGALVTDSERIYSRAAMYHDVGSYERPQRVTTDEPVFPGVNARMPELSAAILRPQLRRLDKQLELRRRRRQFIVDRVSDRPGGTARAAPHHDQASAVGVAIQFDDPEEAARFGAIRGALRLIDSGRHVYTNWRSVTEMSFHHAAMNPYQWNQRKFDYSEGACPATSRILERTCTVETAPELPGPAFRSMYRRLGG